MITLTPTEIRFRRGIFRTRTVRLEDVGIVGLLMIPLNGDPDYVSRWQLEVTDVSGNRGTCSMSSERALKGRSGTGNEWWRTDFPGISETEAGKAASTVLQWVAAHQGEDGPLIASKDFVNNRTGFGFSNPDGPAS
jgi:hypothetical protein